MSDVTEPWKIRIRTAATEARTMIPLENASRPPRVAKCAGRNLSRDMNEVRRGKSAKAVFATSTSKIAVVNWIT